MKGVNYTAESLLNTCVVVCSVVGHTESQQAGDGDDPGSIPSCESRVFLDKKPGKSAVQESPQTLFPHSAHWLLLFVLFRDDRSLRDLTHMSL